MTRLGGFGNSWAKLGHAVADLGPIRLARLLFAEHVLFALGLRSRSSFWVALSLLWCLRPLQRIRAGKTTPLVILIPKLGGEEDFLATIGSRNEHPFVAVKWPRTLIAKLFRAFISDSSTNLKRNSYARLTTGEEAQSIAYEDFLSSVFEELGKRRKISAFVTANVAYVGQREIARASRRQGIPFLILHKECVKSEGQRQLFEKFYREYFGEFAGSAIAVYSREEKISLETSLQIPSNLVVVTGCPRIDTLHDARLGTASLGSKVVLFAIDDRVGVLSPLDAFHYREWPNWALMAGDVEAWFISLARSRPDLEFTLKVKLGTERQVEKRLSGPLPSNLSIIFGGSGTEIVQGARAIVAFNSTVISEGLARGVPVLVPDAKAWFGPQVARWSHDYGDSVISFPDEKSFENLMTVCLGQSRSAAAALTPSAGRKLRAYVGNDDGLAASRALEFIDRFARL